LYPLPDNPVKDWLTWSNSDLELSIIDASNKTAGLMGINKAEDLQYICMPYFIPVPLEMLRLSLTILMIRRVSPPLSMLMQLTLNSFL
jgi:hypothetical protein